MNTREIILMIAGTILFVLGLCLVVKNYFFRERPNERQLHMGYTFIVLGLYTINGQVNEIKASFTNVGIH